MSIALATNGLIAKRDSTPTPDTVEYAQVVIEVTSAEANIIVEQ